MASVDVTRNARTHAERERRIFSAEPAKGPAQHEGRLDLQGRPFRQNEFHLRKLLFFELRGIRPGLLPPELSPVGSVDVRERSNACGPVRLTATEVGGAISGATVVARPDCRSNRVEQYSGLTVPHPPRIDGTTAHDRINHAARFRLGIREVNGRLAKGENIL